MPRHPARGCASLLPSLTVALVACASLAFAATGGRTDDRPTRLEVWDLPLGAQAEQLPDAFVDYACEWEPIPDDGLERFPEGKPRPTFD